MFYLEFQWQKTCKEFMKWKATTDHRLTEIIASVKNLQVYVGTRQCCYYFVVLQDLIGINIMLNAFL
jgi:hypothetical protein